MKTFNSIDEYIKAKEMLKANDQARMNYCMKNLTNAISSDILKTFPFADEVDNDFRSAIEVWEFTNSVPEKYFLYVSPESKTVTTWTGQKLGDILKLGHVFKSNMGDKRQYIKIKAINSKLYSGFFYLSSGDYARVKLIKTK